MPIVCCQLVKKGRFVVAQPWFEPGHTIALGNAKQHAGDTGSLALVAATHKDVGRVIEVLGSVDSVHAAMRGLLAEEGLLGPVPAPGRELGEPSRAVRAQLDELEQGVPGLGEREDCRGDLVVTIDPPTAKDHDDAIGLVAAPDDADHAWVLAVHIADVSAYVTPGSAIDEDALERAMSAYVPGTVAPMLPFELSSDLCSLRPGVDRGCVSAFLDIASDGRVVRSRFARTVIRSARRLTYDQVDEVLLGNVQVDPVIDALISELGAVTKLLREQRMLRGALDMALPEVELELGEVHVEAAKLSAESRSHQLVEECMLLANDAVGLTLAQAKAPGIWRVHDHPDPEAIEALFKQFEKLGIPTPPLPDAMGGRQAANLAADAVQRAVRYAETSRRGRISFPPRVLRALQRAAYRSKPGPHSGLATENYAHFTSPIRRYPDLVVHRSLLNLLGITDQVPATDELRDVAEHVTAVESDLQKLERRADKIAVAYLLHQRMHSGSDMGDEGDGKWHGEVIGMVGGGLFVRFGGVYDGFVPARTLSPDERYELDDDGLAMVGQRSKHAIKLGDPIDVYVDKVDRSNGRIDLRRTSSPRERTNGKGGRPDTRQPGNSGRAKGKGRPQRRRR